jgi:DNA-directed RNA polymerase specialized sigma24 family protein
MTSPGSPSVPPSRFHSTLWSMVVQAADPGSPQAHAALADLCKIYWYPLYAHIRRRSETAEHAEDLTQGFFAHLMENQVLATVDRRKGKFRSFLLGCCNHFLLNVRDYDRAAKRGGGKMPISIDFLSAEDRYRLEPADGLTPDLLFNRKWALAAIENVWATLEQECESDGKGALFTALRPKIIHEPETAQFATIGASLGMSADAVRKAAMRLRRRFGELLRGQIAATVDSPEQVEEEIRDLFAALAE